MQRELAVYGRETQQLIAAFQRETSLKLPEVNKLYETWPLRIVPLQILNDPTGSSISPLKVIIAPPEVDFDKFGATVTGVPKLEKGLAEGLRHFFGKHYSLGNPHRPVEFLGGAWDAKRFHGEASIKALFSMLSSEALLVLESEIDGDYLNMRFAYWAAGQARYAYIPVVTRFHYRESVYESAKARARKWKAAHDLLVQQGKNPKLLNEPDTYNLEVLQEEEQLAELGVDISQLPPRYKLRADDFEPLNQFLLLNHRLVAGLIADVHHLLQHDTVPVLPQWLRELVTEGVALEVLQPVVEAFRTVLQGLAAERPAWVADLELELATSLAALPDKTWAQAILSDSLKHWLSSREDTDIPEGLEARIAAVRVALTLADTGYVHKLQTCLNLLEGQTHALALQKSLAKQQQLETEIERRVQLELQQREQAEAERKAREVAERPAWASKAGRDEYGRYADLAVDGVVQRFRWIESGIFVMGSPEDEPERGDNEVQHEVTLTQGFWLADTACTQRLWQVVMGSNPAKFQHGLENPVEQVSWNEVQNFIQCLNNRVSGLKAALPTEAQWEYACRAGTTSPFAFGMNITPEQVNYHGDKSYAGRKKGFFRCQTIMVKALSPNAWGLYQMHGNVREWCQDLYGEYGAEPQRDPQGPSSSSSSRIYRVVRGGAYNDSATNTRSACRALDESHNCNRWSGFRFALGQ